MPKHRTKATAKKRGSGRRTPTARSRKRRRAKLPAGADFFDRAHRAVKTALRASTDLSTFLESIGELTLEQRKLLVQQARLLLEQNYVHRPLKEAMHAVDPIQRLRLLEHRIDQTPADRTPSELSFHRQMMDIFTSVRDLHTNYLLPAPFDAMVAFLPFDVEECFEDGERKILATHLASGFSHPTFTEGVELVRWNGVPIDRAVEVLADQHAGSNPPARHARGLERLTRRPLIISPPPDEEWVAVDYLTAAGDEAQHRFDWLVFPLPDDPGGDGDDGGNEALSTAAARGLDLEMDLIQRAKKILFAPEVVWTERYLPRRKHPHQGLTSNMPTRLEAEPVETPHGTFGYIRIRSFNVNNPDAFVDEFIRLAGLLPQSGLILDVRGNGGGHIFASEFLLQTLTPKQIAPEPVQFVNTPLNLKICRRHETSPVGIDLSPWADSIAQAVETGATYSRGFPITPVDGANAIGQRYRGPVVLITDARCYSATDIFAAGFKDHGIGRILGVDDNTGAGGANVWDHDLLSALLQVPNPPDPESPYRNLPNGAGMRVSIRRMLRVGERAGTPLEDLGVVPDERHFMTRGDVLDGNVDLIAHAAEILTRLPLRQLDVATTSLAGGDVGVEVTTVGISRLDVFVDGRPRQSLDVGAGPTEFQLSSPNAGARLEIFGYDGGELVAANRVTL